MAHCIDICKVNAWLIYDRYCSQKQIHKKKQLTLLKFGYQIASALIRAGTIVNQVGCPPKHTSKPEKITNIRFDNGSNCPEFRADERNFRLCKTGESRIFCKKCNICWARNCFIEYHIR